MQVFPQLRKLEKKYARELVVIGVHSAKFPNERDAGNLRRAVQRYGLEHPVINDVDFEVWRQYSCRAWPTLVFIDPRGKVIGKQEGELPYGPFDGLLGRMVSEFDGLGVLDRTATPANRHGMPDTTLAFPGKVVADAPGGRLFIADSNHNRILVASLGGAIMEAIGSGDEGLADGGFGSAAFNHPQGMALAGEDLYVADTENHAVRRVDLAARTVETVAGTGLQGYAGDGRGPGRSMELASPWDLAFQNGTLYIAMAGMHQLWSMTPADGTAGPHAGSGREALLDGPLLSAALAQPSGITGGGETLYFADSETSSIRSADLGPAGRVRTIVGLDLFVFGDVDGTGDDVRLQHPLGIDYIEGALYVADTYNHKIKRVLPATRGAFTLLGEGQPGHRDGPGNQARFSEPGGLSAAGGKLYIADTNNHAIRVADLETLEVTTLELSGV